jgi:hypothetical protein
MGVGGHRHAPAALPPGMTRYPLYRRLRRCNYNTTSSKIIMIHYSFTVVGQWSISISELLNYSVIITTTIFNYVNPANPSQYPGKKKVHSILLKLFLCLVEVPVPLGLHRVENIH